MRFGRLTASLVRIKKMTSLKKNERIETKLFFVLRVFFQLELNETDRIEATEFELDCPPGDF